MSKVTSKLQVTVPKAIADRFGIRPGDELEWIPGEESIRVEVARKKRKAPLSEEARVRLFDQATARQRERQKGVKPAPPGTSRGWTREELYDRGRSD